MILHIFKSFNIRKSSLIYLVLMTSIILFLALFLTNCIVCFIKEKNTWINNHDYYRQITYLNHENDNDYNVKCRRINISYDVSLEGKENFSITVGHINSSNYLFESDINSGFDIVGKKELLENDIILSSYMFDALELDLSELNKISLWLNNELQTYNVIGYFNSEYSSYLKEQGFYPDVIINSDYTSDNYIFTMEFSSINVLRNTDLKSNSINYIDDFSSMNTYFTIVNIFFIILLIFVIFLSSSSLITLFSYLVLENINSLFILNALGIKRRTFISSIIIFVGVYLAVAIFLAVIFLCITRTILYSASIELIYGDLNLLSFNIYSVLINYFISVPIFILVSLLSCKKLINNKFS